MKTKRDLAASLVCIASIFVIACYAYAAQRSKIALDLLMKDPLFLVMAIISCASLIGVIVLGYLLWHNKNTNCNNTACSFHPRFKGNNNGYDFSSIQTPAELIDGSLSLAPIGRHSKKIQDQKVMDDFQEFNREELMQLIQDVLPAVDEPVTSEIPLYVDKDAPAKPSIPADIPLWVEKTPLEEESPVAGIPMWVEKVPLEEEAPVAEIPMWVEKTPLEEEAPVAEIPMWVEKTLPEEEPVIPEIPMWVEKTPFEEEPIIDELPLWAEESLLDEEPVMTEIPLWIDKPLAAEIPLWVDKTSPEEEAPLLKIPMWDEKPALTQIAPYRGGSSKDASGLHDSLVMDAPQKEKPSMELTEDMILLIVEKLREQEPSVFRQAS